MFPIRHRYNLAAAKHVYALPQLPQPAQKFSLCGGLFVVPTFYTQILGLFHFGDRFLLAGLK